MPSNRKGDAPEEPDLHRRVPLTSIATAGPCAPGEVRIDPYDAYLVLIAQQARTALAHLDATWAIEDGPMGIKEWYGPVNEEVVWSHLQGAMFAGVVISRTLKPSTVRIRANQGFADNRGAKLRDLLEVPDDAVLLTIARVRDAIEHLDERLDTVVLAGDIHSVSDWYIARGVRFQTATRVELANEPTAGRHANMRLFAPEMGLLLFDDETFDLFAFEVELHSLLASMPDAHARLRAETAPGAMHFGRGKIAAWTPKAIAGRRAEVARARAEIASEGRSTLRPVSRPRTVDWREIDDPPE